MTNTHSASEAFTETIAAIATAPGRGGVGIVRISGPDVTRIGSTLLERLPAPRQASYGAFTDLNGTTLDQGIALFFQGPNSFTGEDVLELQAHGGPVILDLILQQTLKLGARLARPGEFSERAFLNDKLDLAQAEAIADLINSTSEHAARSALRSLQGAFSDEIHRLVELLTHLRVYVEAAIDFPEEEIDFLADGKVQTDLRAIQKQLQSVLIQAQQGAILQEGMNVVIAGRPNAGKSSLLNALAGKESAIVTDIAGTTRDVLREHIHINGMPLHIIDTAGLRDGADVVEKIGIERAWSEIRNADRVLLMVDATSTDACHPEQIWPDFISHLPDLSKVTVIRNKVDLNNEATGLDTSPTSPVIRLSAKQQLGLDELRQHLMDCMGYEATNEGGFMARRRHLEALQTADNYLKAGAAQLTDFGAGELLAEDLRLAQNALAEITGEFSSDDLLGEIFSSFCIGK